MRDAVGRLVADRPDGPTVGSAFAISAELALTAFHCVRGQDGKATDRKLWLRLGDQALPLAVGPFAARSDLAVLQLEQRLPDGFRPLPIALPGAAFEEQRVRLEGFPDDWPHADQALRLGGVLRDAAASLGGDVPALGLYSEEVAAGRDPSGCSGGPVRVRLRYRRDDGDRESDWVAIGTVRWGQEVEEDSERIGRGGQVFAAPLPQGWPDLEALVVEGEPVGRERALLSRLIVPFGQQAAKADHFVGRERLLAEIRRATVRHDRAYIHLEAAAGLGKTALAAHFARAEDAPAFFVDASGGTIHAAECLNHLTAELILRNGLRQEELPEGSGLNSAVFGQVLRQATTAQAGPVWLVVDALDEAEAVAQEANPLLLPAELPLGAFVLLTSRNRDSELLTHPGTPLVSLRIAAEAQEQHLDAARHIEARLAEDPDLAAALERIRPPTAAAELAARLAAAGEGNFQYIEYVLEDLREHSREGSDPFDLDSLASHTRGNLESRLRRYYEVRFWGPMTTVRRTEPDRWKGLFRPVLEQILVAAEAVPASWIAAALDVPEREVAESVLQPWRRFLRVDRRDGVDRWRIVHSSFADFLGDRFDLPALHAATADRLLADEGADGYANRHLSTHLRLGGREGKLRSLVADPRWEAAQRRIDPTGELFLNDLNQAWLAAEEPDQAAVAAGEPTPGLGREVWSALAVASTLSEAQIVPPRLLAVLVETGVWSLERACATARQAPDAEHRAEALARLAPWDESLAEEAVATAAQIELASTRAKTTVAAAASMDPERARQAVDDLLAESIAMDPWYGAHAIVALVPELDERQLQKAAEAGRLIEDSIERSALLTALARRLPGLAADPAATGALRELKLPETVIAAVAAQPSNPALAEAALGEAGAGNPEFFGTNPNTLWLLQELAPLASAPYLLAAAERAGPPGRLGECGMVALIGALTRKGHGKEALDWIRRLPRLAERGAALRAVAADLPAGLVEPAYEIAEASLDPEALAALIPRLPAERRSAAARAAIPAVNLKDRAERLLLLAELAGAMTPAQADRSLELARDLEADSRLERVLTALAPVVSERRLPEVWSQISRLEHGRQDAPSEALLRRAPEPLFSRAARLAAHGEAGPRTLLAIGERIASAGSTHPIGAFISKSPAVMPRAVQCLAPVLSGADAEPVLGRLSDREALRVKALRTITAERPTTPEVDSLLSADLTLGLDEHVVCGLLAPALVRRGRPEEGLAAVSSVPSDVLRARALAQLAPRLDANALRHALAAAQEISSWPLRMGAEGALAEFLDVSQLGARCELLHEDAEASASGLLENHREQFHASILPLEIRLPGEARTATLNRLRAALDEAHGPPGWYLLDAVTWSRRELPFGHHLPLPREVRSALYPTWNRLLHEVAALNRRAVLETLAGAMAAIPAIGGMTAATDTAEAVLEIGLRWD